jgi:hypothetical protein
MRSGGAVGRKCRESVVPGVSRHRYRPCGAAVHRDQLDTSGLGGFVVWCSITGRGNPRTVWGPGQLREDRRERADFAWRTSERGDNVNGAPAVGLPRSNANERDLVPIRRPARRPVIVGS